MALGTCYPGNRPTGRYLGPGVIDGARRADVSPLSEVLTKLVLHWLEADRDLTVNL